MRVLWLLPAGLLAFGALAPPVAAQGYQRIPTCGTGVPPAGVSPGYMDSTGLVCGSATVTGSVTATTSATASATPTAVAAGTGKPINISTAGSELFTTISIGGTIVPAGHGTAATALRVELPSDGTGIVGTQGLAASGATVSGNPLLQGGRAENAEPTAVTNGQAVAAAYDLVGKAVTSPYANKENFISGCGNATGTSGTSVISAQGAGVKIYVTQISVANTGATTSLMTIQIDAAGSPSTLWTTINPTIGGSNMTFPVPLVVTANKAVGFTAASSSSTQYVCISGYTGT